MSEDRDDWGRRLDAGETTDVELRLASRLRAARPASPPLPHHVEAALRELLLSQPRPSLWQTLNLRWWAATAASGLVLALVVAAFMVLSRPDLISPPTAQPAAPDSVAALPTWPAPTPFQASAGDWVTLTVLAPAVGAELSPDVEVVTVRADYRLASAPSARLRLELRSRLDFDSTDWGSDLTNLVDRQFVDVVQGTGASTVALALDRKTLARFPAGSELVLSAHLLGDDGAVYFAQVFETLSFTAPDSLRGCVFDPARDRLEIVSVTPGTGGLLSETNPRVRVTVRYQLSVPQPELVTLVGGLANPAWSGTAATTHEWLPNLGAFMAYALPNASGTATLDLYSWYASEATRGIADETGRVAVALALVCGNEMADPLLLYGRLYPEHTVEFAPELLRRAAPDAVSVVAASPAPGLELPAGLVQFDVTVAVTLTSAPTATLVVGLGDDARAGTEVHPRSGPLFAIGSTPVTVTAAEPRVTVRFFADADRVAEQLAGREVYVFANLSRQTESGWVRLAHTLDHDFHYRHAPAAVAMRCAATAGPDEARITAASIAPGPLPDEPVVIDIDVDYTLSVPAATLLLGFTSPAADPSDPSRSLVDGVTVIIYGGSGRTQFSLTYAPDDPLGWLLRSVAQDDVVALRLGIRCGVPGGETRWLFSDVPAEYRYTLPARATPAP